MQVTPAPPLSDLLGGFGGESNPTHASTGNLMRRASELLPPHVTPSQFCCRTKRKATPNTSVLTNGIRHFALTEGITVTRFRYADDINTVAVQGMGKPRLEWVLAFCGWNVILPRHISSFTNHTQCRENGCDCLHVNQVTSDINTSVTCHKLNQLAFIYLPSLIVGTWLVDN